MHALQYFQRRLIALGFVVTLLALQAATALAAVPALDRPGGGSC